MYSPEAVTRDMSGSLLFSSSSSSKTSMENDFLKSKDFLGSNVFQAQSYQQQQQQHQHHHHQQQQNCGLTRYRSAPSSFFASLLNADINDDSLNRDDFLSQGSPSSESDTMFSSFMNCNGTSNSESRDLGEISNQQKGQMPFGADMKQESVEKCGLQQNANGFLKTTSEQQHNLGYETHLNGNCVGSYSLGMENQFQMQIQGKMNQGNGSNLLRQSSSPAGFFAGFDVMREVGNFRAGNGANGETCSSTSGLNNHMHISTGPTSSSGFMPSIAENESWNGSSVNNLKRDRDGELKMFSNYNGLTDQNGESRTYTPPPLTHHLSLPKTSAEMAAIDKYLQFQQDSIPCKIRAKRGCATHPRSIAERMRRTRISERMKKLQELFPSMDKQTNTADMLDLAVEYIKDLQNQVQALTDKKAKCTCSSSSHHHTNPGA